MDNRRTTRGNGNGGYPSNFPGTPTTPSPNRVLSRMSNGAEGLIRNSPFAQHYNRYGNGIGNNGETRGELRSPHIGRTPTSFRIPNNRLHIHDPTEFPSLTNQMTATPPPRSRSNTTTTTSTPISLEDFPLLPSTPMTRTTMPNIDERIMREVQEFLTSPEAKAAKVSKKIYDQFGLLGLTTVVRMAKEEPNLVALSYGIDLTTLGVDENSKRPVYPTFTGPFGSVPVLAEDQDYPVPVEYRMSQLHRFVNPVSRKQRKLPELIRVNDDILFYLFYTYCQDSLQILAAAELFSRGWRFHKEEKQWLKGCSPPGMTLYARNYEKGKYIFFDPISWKKVPHFFCVEYCKLEGRPVVPTEIIVQHYFAK